VASILASIIRTAAIRRSSSATYIRLMGSKLTVHNSRSSGTQTKRSINPVPLLTPAVT
jgi:hypothetical protein